METMRCDLQKTTLKRQPRLQPCDWYYFPLVETFIFAFIVCAGSFFFLFFFGPVHAWVLRGRYLCTLGEGGSETGRVYSRAVRVVNVIASVEQAFNSATFISHLTDYFLPAPTLPQSQHSTSLPQPASANLGDKISLFGAELMRRVTNHTGCEVFVCVGGIIQWWIGLDGIGY